LVCWNFIENPANKSLVDKQTFEGQEIAYIDEKLHFTFFVQNWANGIRMFISA